MALDNFNGHLGLLVLAIPNCDFLIVLIKLLSDEWTKWQKHVIDRNEMFTVRHFRGGET